MTRFFEILNEAGKAEVIINGPISNWPEDVNAEQFVKDFEKLIEDNEKVKVRILNSPGGSVFEGLPIFTVIRSNMDKVEISIEGLAASMAAFIALAGSKLYIGKYAKMMIHRPMGGVMGQAGDMEAAAKMLRDFETDLTDLIMQKTGKSEIWVKEKLLKETDTWISASEAKEWGLVDGIFDQNKEIKNSIEYTAAALLNTNINKNKVKMEDLKLVNQAAGLNEDATAVELVQVVSTFRTQVNDLNSTIDTLNQEKNDLTAKVDQANETIQAMNDELELFRAQADEAKKNAAELLVDEALEAGKITESVKATWTEMATNDYAGTQKLLENIPVKAKGGFSLDDYFKDQKADAGTQATDEIKEKAEKLEHMRKNKPAELAEMRKNNPDMYNDLMDAYRSYVHKKYNINKK
jgi:ATP-dependent Clp endopeptidase proteolytic subunit ClpP